MGEAAETAAAQVVRFIRRTAPATAANVADHMNWSLSKTHQAITSARRRGLLTRIGKDDHQRVIFAAVQGADWPAAATQEVCP